MVSFSFKIFGILNIEIFLFVFPYLIQSKLYLGELLNLGKEVGSRG
jgi:hypothetical protein